jgi:hypothetical protein
MKSFINGKLRHLDANVEPEIIIFLSQSNNLQSIAESLNASSRSYAEVKKDLLKPYTDCMMQSITLLTKDDRRIIVTNFDDNKGMIRDKQDIDLGTIMKRTRNLIKSFLDCTTEQELADKVVAADTETLKELDGQIDCEEYFNVLDKNEKIKLIRKTIKQELSTRDE